MEGREAQILAKEPARDWALVHVHYSGARVSPPEPKPVVRVFGAIDRCWRGVYTFHSPWEEIFLQCASRLCACLR
jgi:hypothetical protein